jgi:hypothetical protein
MSLKTHGKSIALGVGAVIMAAVTGYRAVASDGVTLAEWITVSIAVVGAINVWATANVPAFSKAKTAVAALFLALNLLVGFLTDGRLTGDEVMLLVIQVLASLGVAFAPAVSTLTRLNPTAPAKFVSGGTVR